MKFCKILFISFCVFVSFDIITCAFNDTNSTNVIKERELVMNFATNATCHKFCNDESCVEIFKKDNVSIYQHYDCIRNEELDAWGCWCLNKTNIQPTVLPKSEERIDKSISTSTVNISTINNSSSSTKKSIEDYASLEIIDNEYNITDPSRDFLLQFSSEDGCLEYCERLCRKIKREKKSDRLFLNGECLYHERITSWDCWCFNRTENEPIKTSQLV